MCGSTATTSTANSRASRPPHHGFRDFNALLIRKSDSEREQFSWSHGQIAGKAAAGTREVPDNALALEWSSAGVFYSRRGVKEGASARKVANYGIVSGESREG